MTYLTTESSKPGHSRIVSKRVSISVCTLSCPRGCGSRRCSSSSIVIPTLARGARLGESKASSRCVLTFVERQPLSRRSWKKIATSFTESRLAKMRDMIRLCRASLWGSQSGI